MPVLHQLKEIKHLLFVQRPDPEIVYDDEVGVGQPCEELGESSLHACVGNLFEEFENVEVAYLVAEHAGLMAQGCRQPALACARGSCDKDGDAALDVAARGHFHDPVLVQPPAGVEQSLRQCGLISEPGLLDQACVAVLLPLLALCLEHEQQPVAQRHAVRASGLDERLPALVHARQPQLLENR